MPIDASQPEDAGVFPTLVRKFKIGARVEVAVIRDGKDQKIALELPQAPVAPRELKKYKDEIFEFTARDLAFEDRVREKLGDAQKGVLVEAVEPAGWAALAHMAVGDLLLAVGPKSVNDVAALETAMTELAGKKPKHVVFFVRRGVHTMYLEIEPDWNRGKSGETVKAKAN
jgi:S1-C subfamily serine protease